MAQIAFWSPTGNQVGSTSILSSVASIIALERDYTSLMLSTNYMDNSLETSFINVNKLKARSTIDFTDVGLDALERLIKSNKISVENLADYTTPILKGRLDLMFGSQKDSNDTYEKVLDLIPGVLRCANTLYDLCYVDIVGGLPNDKIMKILGQSDLIVVSVGQSMRKLEEFFDKIIDCDLLKEKPFILVISKYDRYSKYNAKNLTKSFKYREKIHTLPYNTQFFDMQNDHRTLEFFIKYLNVEPSDRNGFFISEVKSIAEEILANVSSSADI